VARLGDAALAGVGAGGNGTFVIMALTQMLGVGTVALVAHAAGRRSQAEANGPAGHRRRILNIGLPAGGEFLMIFLIVGVA
jgi:Na+-driven multidrug efflux pump